MFSILFAKRFISKIDKQEFEYNAEQQLNVVLMPDGSRVIAASNEIIMSTSSKSRSKPSDDDPDEGTGSPSKSLY